MADPYSDAFCAQGNWEGGPFPTDEKDNDPWEDCKDYRLWIIKTFNQFKP